MKNVYLYLLTGVLLLLLSSLLSAEEFPGRKEFPDVNVMLTQELNQRFDEVVIVDTRSQYEYETLRIKGSINIPVSQHTFEKRLRRIRARSSKAIVFYCNGRTCYKSYIAAKKARQAGVNKVYAYDAGVFEWVINNPDKGELLGQAPVDTKQLIVAQRFKSRLLKPAAFSERILELGKDSMVLDIRDEFQRAGVGFFPGKERWASLDDKNKLLRVLRRAKKNGKTLFIYDEVGKQVRWLQYALEDLGFENYYFMDKGAKAYYSMISDWK